MKIGILTTYFADYGSFFQAYCLLKYIQALGHTCELLHFCGRYRYSPRLKYGVLGMKYLPRTMSNLIASKYDIYRTFLNLRADLDNLEISDGYYKAIGNV